MANLPDLPGRPSLASALASVPGLRRRTPSELAALALLGTPVEIEPGAEVHQARYAGEVAIVVGGDAAFGGGVLSTGSVIGDPPYGWKRSHPPAATIMATTSLYLLSYDTEQLEAMLGVLRPSGGGETGQPRRVLARA
jgi:hypothetical protein